MEFEMKILDEIKKVPRETPLHDERDRPKRSLKSLISKRKKDSEKDFRHKYFVGRIPHTELFECQKRFLLRDVLFISSGRCPAAKG